MQTVDAYQILIVEVDRKYHAVVHKLTVYDMRNLFNLLPNDEFSQSGPSKEQQVGEYFAMDE